MIEIKPTFVLFMYFYMFAGEMPIIICAYLSAFIHEISHIISGYILGYKLECFSAHMCGFCAKFRGFERPPFLKEVIISASGPLANLIIMTVFSLLKDTFIISEHIIKINLFLFIINVIPVMPLDGGRILYAFLKSEFSAKKAKKIINIISVTVSLVVIFISFYTSINKSNISFLLVSVYILSNISMCDFEKETESEYKKIKCYSCDTELKLADFALSAGIKEDTVIFVTDSNKIKGLLTGIQLKESALNNQYDETLGNLLCLGGTKDGNGNA